jgi:hypothetical protein
LTSSGTSTYQLLPLAGSALNSPQFDFYIYGEFKVKISSPLITAHIHPKVDFMGFFEDMFKQKYGYRHHDSHHFGLYLIGNVLKRIIHSRTLLIFLVMVLLLIVFAVVALVIALWPLFIKFIAYVNQNGLKGVFDFVFSLINRIWEGGGKT